MPRQVMNVSDFIKRNTSIPSKFVDEVYGQVPSLRGIGEFVIPLDYVVKLLQTTPKTLLGKLERSYKKEVDYTVIPSMGKTKRVFLTPECFKRVAMMSRSKGGEMVRSYLIELEGLFLKYRQQTLAGMQMEIDRLQGVSRR